jgi:hypothetical protein
MLTRVFGAAICFLSFVAIMVNTFLILNSSAYFDYNNKPASMSIAEAGNFYPYFIAAITMTLGILLVRDRVLESDHH